VSAAFGQLRSQLWNEDGVRLKTKIDLYDAVVLNILLYSCETWDYLQTSHTQPGQVSSQMSEAHNWHKMARQNTKHGSFRALQHDRN